MILKTILSKIDDWAPPGIAQSYDNVGIQVGDPNQDVKVGLIALEITPEVIREAEDIGAQLILTHHPLLFRPLRSLTPTTLIGSMVLRLARSEIAVVAAHTNLDAVKEGVSAALAELIGLTNPRFLAPTHEGALKLVTFVPEDHLEKVREALSREGAGRIGDYSDVAFKNRGVGIFRPLSMANPFTKTSAGDLENVPEWRIEVALTRDRLPAAIRALHDTHPYETPVYDIYEMADTVSGFGLGMVGELEKSVTLSTFLSHVCQALATPTVRYAGDLSAPIRRVAVCGGAGRDLIDAAMRSGADAYVTADITYHTFFDVLNPDNGFRMALIDAGHYETEVATEQLLLNWLKEHLAPVSWVKTSVRTSPVRSFIAP